MSLSEFVSSAMGGEHLPAKLHTVTVSLRLPTYRVDQLDHVASFLGVSRQVLLSRIVESGLYEVAELIGDEIAEDPSRGPLQADQFMDGFTALDWSDAVDVS